MCFNIDKLMVLEEVSTNYFKWNKFNYRIKKTTTTLKCFLKELEMRRKRIKECLLNERVVTENNLIKNKNLFGIKDFGLTDNDTINRCLKYISVFEEGDTIDYFEDKDTLKNEDNHFRIEISYIREKEYAPYPFCSDFNVYYEDDDEDEIDFYLVIKYFINDKKIIELKQDGYLCGYIVGFDYSKSGFLFEIDRELGNASGDGV